MKSILFSILFLFVPKLVISQVSKNDKTIYLDSLWQETTQGNHQYYRIIKDYYSDLKEYKTYDYYKNDTLKTTATISGKNNGSYIGEKTTYYTNGNKKNITNYIKGSPIGKTLNYYENGNLKEEGEYTNNYETPGKYYKLNQYWDENKNHLIIDGNGIYSSDNNVDYIETGKYKDGYKDGVFEGKNLKKHTSFIEKYENGKFISGIRTFADNTKSEYSEMEKKPLPKKGIQDFYNYIGKNFTKTKEAIQNKISGKLYLSFVIDKDGKIVEPRIVKPLGYGLEEEAIRVITNYENWIPGQQRGMNVRVLYTIPITVGL
ncbi:MAG: hypothetical protein RLZZ540_3477 [Bacteroidota bacterium]|jgi:hypothetical protein